MNTVVTFFTILIITFMIVIIAFITTLVVLYIMALIWHFTRFKPCKKLFHDKLNLHVYDENKMWVTSKNDKTEIHSVCKICGKELIRSKCTDGNWVMFDDNN